MKAVLINGKNECEDYHKAFAGAEEPGSLFGFNNIYSGFIS